MIIIENHLAEERQFGAAISAAIPHFLKHAKEASASAAADFTASAFRPSNVNLIFLGGGGTQTDIKKHTLVWKKKRFRISLLFIKNG